MTDAVVYKLYSHRPLCTTATQLAVSTGTIAMVVELCVQVLSADVSARRRSLRITHTDISARRP